MDELKKVKICKACGFIGVEVKFKKDRLHYENTCKPCDSLLQKKYRADHVDRCRETGKLWRSRNKEKKAIAAKLWRIDNPEKANALIKKHRYSRYGITEAIFLEMLNAQENKCKICNKEFLWTCRVSAPQIDHDHKCCPTSCKCCGKCIRGLLCQDCNRYLGRIKDNPEVSDRMSNYLRKK